MPKGSLISIIPDNLYLFKARKIHVAGWRSSGNIAIIKGKKGLAIIDSGTASTRSSLRQLIIRMRSLDELIFCLHTHGHIDHVGGDNMLMDEFSARIFASKDAIAFVEKQSPLAIEEEKKHMIVSFHELFTAPELFVKGVMKLAFGRSKSVSGVVCFGENSDPAGTDFLPIELPGHHPGHFGFFNSKEGVLICGDLIDPRHKMKPLLTSPSSNFEGMVESISTAERLSPQILVPGHGNPIFGKLEVCQAFQEAKKKLDTTRDAVLCSLESASTTLPILSKRLKRHGMGPGNVYRRMFIHSILCHLLNEGSIKSDRSNPRKTIFHLCRD